MSTPNTVPCRNFNHGRMNVAINYCPDCGQRFESRTSSACDGPKHAEFRKQRFSFCIHCGARLLGK